MSGVHFVQQCPTCGRRLHILLDYMGRRLSCEHCGGTFTAGVDAPSPGDAIHRATQLLASVNQLRMEQAAQEDFC
ncbi:MAG: hypothetical protein KDB14_24805 [Planctomycetales bacterium]|nr:hypothetical protein [Planctomycetales bacterium]